MKHAISNGFFELCADTMGAELASVKAVRDGYEYIWQRSEIWKGQSPILFPVVGKLKNDELKLRSATYAMPKHGFARRSEFEFDGGGEELSFSLIGSRSRFPNYPFDFKLKVAFRLNDCGYEVIHTVVNTGVSPLWFSLGAHPAFNISLGDRLIMDKQESCRAHTLGADGLIRRETVPVFSNSRVFEIRADSFDRGALIFEGLKSRKCTLKKADGRDVQVEFGDAPCLGLWAKPGANYVCIEPWYGMDDAEDADACFEDKKYVQKLDSQCEFVFPLRIKLM